MTIQPRTTPIGDREGRGIRWTSTYVPRLVALWCSLITCRGSKEIPFSQAGTLMLASGDLSSLSGMEEEEWLESSSASVIVKDPVVDIVCLVVTYHSELDTEKRGTTRSLSACSFVLHYCLHAYAFIRRSLYILAHRYWPSEERERPLGARSWWELELCSLVISLDNITT